jgi:transposase-like protein
VHAPRKYDQESWDRAVRPRMENAELRRANEILETVSAFFAAAELDHRLS